MKKYILPLITVALLTTTALSGCSSAPKATENGGAYTASIREEFKINDGVKDTELFELGRSYCLNNVRDASSTKIMIKKAYNMDDDAAYEKFESITQDKLCLPGNFKPMEPSKEDAGK